MKKLALFLLLSPVYLIAQEKTTVQPITIEVEDQDVEIQEEVFMVVEQMPEFPGGQEALFKYLSSSIHYPDEALESQIGGKVFVSFTIEKSGAVGNVKVIKGIGGGCDEESVRVVNAMPNWIPGKQRGKEVRVQYNLPIMFVLPTERPAVPSVTE